MRPLLLGVFPSITLSQQFAGLEIYDTDPSNGQPVEGRGRNAKATKLPP